MKFLPAPDLWNPAVNHAVRTGQLKLLPGQWVKCGSNKLSRFCGVGAAGTIVATHFDGRSVPLWKFQSNLQYARSVAARVARA